MLAVAERNAPGLLDGEDQGAEVGASVRAVAIGLPIGLSTSTPGIATRLEFEHGRFLVGYLGLCHGDRFPVRMKGNSF